MKLLTLLLFTLSIDVWACTINTHRNLITINKIQDQSIITSSDCNEVTRDKFLNIISSTSGEISARHISSYLAEELNQKISVKPKKINIIQATDFFKRELKLPKDLIIKNITSLYNKSSIGLKSLDIASISCKRCNSLGLHSIKFETKNKKIWLSALIHKEHNVFVARQDIDLKTTQLSPELFTEKIITSDQPQFYLKNINHLKYMKLSSFIKQGDKLKRSHVLPRVLVRHGQPVRLVFDNGLVRLQGNAIAKGIGRIGEKVKVFNINSKKFIWAQVSGENTVVVK